MRIQLQNIAIKILNSNYKFLFNLIISLIIYACFYGNLYYASFCTNENISLIAEPKAPIIKGTKIQTPLQTEVGAFLDQAGFIKEQEEVINRQREEIQGLLQAKEELKKERDLFETEKKQAEDLQKKYKKAYERKEEYCNNLTNNYRANMKKAFIAGRNFDGKYGFGLIAASLAIIVIAISVDGKK